MLELHDALAIGIHGYRLDKRPVVAVPSPGFDHPPGHDGARPMSLDADPDLLRHEALPTAKLIEHQWVVEAHQLDALAVACQVAVHREPEH